METIKEKLVSAWLLVSALALVILYYLYDRRGRALTELHLDAQKALLAKDLKIIESDIKSGEVEREEVRNRYLALKHRHRSILSKLGIGTDSKGDGSGGGTP